MAGRRSRRLAITLSLIFVALSLMLAACAVVQPVIKIGLVAPFDGRFRAVGYEAVYAARLAVRQINARGGVNGYRLELVALDDRGEPDRAIEAAQQLIIDPQVVAVIGHFRPDSTGAAMTVYCAAGMPWVALQSTAAGRCAPGMVVIGRGRADQWPANRITFAGSVPDPNTRPAAREFVAGYNAIPIDGTRAGPIALQTYELMYLLFDAIARAEKIDRAEIAASLASSHYQALSGAYAFDQAGSLIEDRSFWYVYDRAGRPQPITP